MRRSELTRQKPRTVTVDLGEGDTVELTFDANRITPAWVREAQRRDEADDVQSLPKSLAEVILAWDVTEDDGSAFPPNADNLSFFSYPAQSELMKHILKAAAPPSEEGKLLKRALVLASSNLFGSSGDVPEWAGTFAVADTLGIPVPDVDDTPVEWVVRAQMWNEAQDAARRHQEARRN